MKRFTLQWNGAKPLVQFLMLICIFMVFAMVASIFLMFVPLRNPLLQQAISQLIMFGLACVSWGLMFRGQVFGYLEHNRNGVAYYIVFAIALVIVAIPFLDGIGIWNDSWHFKGDETLRLFEENAKNFTNNLLTDTSVSALIGNIVVLALVPAVLEEWFFRGIMQKTLTDLCKNAYVGVVITAIIFSLAHFEFFSCIARVVLGVILGCLYLWSGNIGVNITFHFLNNLFVVLAGYLYNSHIIDVNLNNTGVFFTPALFFASLACLTLFFIVEIRKQKGIKPKHRLTFGLKNISKHKNKR